MLVKDRYEYPIDDTIYEFDVFREDLLGLVLVDVEFSSIAERDSFVMPDFCLADVTYDEWVAGGMLAGKTLNEVRDYFMAYDYQPLL
jgi:CYTH domain-containing protein